MASGRFNWLRQAVLPAGLAAMEACWTYPWALLMGLWVRPGGEAPLLSGAGIFFLLIAGRMATQLVLGQGWPLARARACLVALGLLAVLLAVRVEHYGALAPADPAWLGALVVASVEVFSHSTAPPFAALLGLYLWWRGIAGGRTRAIYDDIEGAFKLGLAALVSLLLVAAVVTPARQDLLQASAAASVIGFFFAGLVSLALARLEAVREYGRARGGTAPRLDGQWLAGSLAVTAVLLALALGFARLLSFDLIAAVADPILGPLGTIVWLLFYAVALLIGLLLVPLIYLLRLLLRPEEVPAPLQPQDMSFMEQLESAAERGGLPPEVLLVIKWAAVGVLIGLVVLLLARAVFRRGWGQDEDVVEERDSVWTWHALRAGLLAWLRGRFAGWRAEKIPTRGPPATAPVEAAPVATVREVYRQVLRLGAAMGWRRVASATPYEHLPGLRARLRPEEDVAAITEAYVRARYGTETPAEPEVREAEARWRRLQAAAAAESEEQQQ